MIWLLSFLPNFIVHIIAIVGILLTVGAIAFGQIPFIGTYNIPINIIGVVLIIFGFYLEGGISDNANWQAKVKEMELKVAKAEAQSAETNTKLAYEINVKNKIIKENSNANAKAITKYVVDECKLSNVAVSLHNSSSQNEVPGSTIGTITGTSEIKTSELLTTVNENYSTYYELVNIVKGWQEWYRKNKEIYDNVK